MHLIARFQKRTVRDVQEELMGNRELFNTYIEKDVVPHLLHSDEIYYDGDDDYLDSMWFPLHPSFVSTIDYKLLGVIGTGCYSTCYLSKHNNEYCVVVVSNMKYDPKTLLKLKSIQNQLDCTCKIFDIITYNDSIAVYDKDHDYFNHNESRCRECPSSIVELDADRGVYVIIVQELLTPLDYYIERVTDTKRLREGLIEIYTELDDYGLCYQDPKVDNYAVTVDGDLRFIDLESVHERGNSRSNESIARDIDHVISTSFDRGVYKYRADTNFRFIG